MLVRLRTSDCSAVDAVDGGALTRVTTAEEFLKDCRCAESPLREATDEVEVALDNANVAIVGVVAVLVRVVREHSIFASPGPGPEE